MRSRDASKPLLNLSTGAACHTTLRGRAPRLPTSIRLGIDFAPQSHRGPTDLQLERPFTSQKRQSTKY